MILASILARSCPIQFLGPELKGTKLYGLCFYDLSVNLSGFHSSGLGNKSFLSPLGPIPVLKYVPFLIFIFPN